MAMPAEAMAMQLTPELLEQLKEEAARIEAERIAKLDDVGQSLEGTKDEAVKARRPLDRRMQDDWDQYNSRPIGGKATKEFSADEPDYRRARDNLTRPKVLMMRARLADLLFPTNESNWDLKASPIPDLPDASAFGIDPATGEQVQGAQLAVAIKAEADKRAGVMKRYCEDQLSECQFDAEGRDGLFYLSLHGTCVVEGPYTKSVKQQAWTTDPTTGVSTITKRYVDKPAARCIRLDSFYPQPCRRLREAEHAFVLELMTKKQVRALAKQPGFHPGQIERLLKTAPDMGSVLRESVTRRADGGYETLEAAMEGRYPMWRYVGPVPKDGMTAFIELLMDSTRDDGLAPLIDEIAESQLDVVYSEVWMSQGIVIKAAPLSLDDDDCLPFHETCLERDPDNWAGYGVAYWLRDDQISRDSLWQAMLLNAFMSAGVQIGVVKGKMEPESGKKYDLTCTRPRAWVMKDEDTDITKALSVWTVPNVLGGIMPMYEQVGRNADERSLMPLIMQGDTTRATPTSSGIAMLMNTANVALAMIARSWDDDITRPLIRGFVQWNMKFNPDPLCKGDFDVQPKAASYLLIKDIKAQHIQVVTQLALNPAFAPYFHMDKLARKNVELLDTEVEGLLKTEDEIRADAEAAAQNPPQDPLMLNAQANMTRAQAAAQKVEADAQRASSDQQFKLMMAERQDALARAEMQVRAAELQGHAEERQARILEARARLEIEQMELVQAGQLKLNELTSKHEIARMEQAMEEFTATLDARLRAHEIAQKGQSLQAQVQMERPFRAQ